MAFHVIILAGAILLPIQALAMEEDYVVEPLEENPGIYYDHLGSLQLSRTHWKLVTGIDVGQLLTSRPDIEPPLRQIKEICKMNSWSACPADTLRIELDAKLRNAGRYEQILQGTLGKPLLRTRRSAPLGFIGSLSKTLFGTATEDDLQYYNNEIDKIYKDQRKLSLLMANQTHILTSEFKRTQDTLHSLSGSTTAMNNKITDLVSETKFLRTQEAQLELHVNVAAWTYQLTRHVDEYVSALITISDAVIFAKLGILHAALLAPRDLVEACTTIKEKTKLELPFSSKDLQTEQIQGVANINAAYNRGRVIVIIDIPLLEEAVFQLYHLLPLPSFENILPNVTSPVIMQPNTEYLAINIGSSEYLLPSREYIQTCKSQSKKFICNPSLPILNSKLTPSCEIKVLTNPGTINWKTCNLKIAPNTPVSVRHLEATNSWIYSVNATTSLRITCNKKSAGFEQIQGAGVVQIRGGCEAKLGNVKLLTQEIITTTREQSISPSIRLNTSSTLPELTPHHVQIIKKHQERTETSGAEYLDSNLLALEDIERQAKELAAQERNETIRQYLTYGGPSAGIIIVVILVFGIFVYRQKGMRGRDAPKITIETIPRNLRPISSPIPLSITEFPEDIILPSTASQPAEWNHPGHITTTFKPSNL